MLMKTNDTDIHGRSYDSPCMDIVTAAPESGVCTSGFGLNPDLTEEDQLWEWEDRI